MPLLRVPHTGTEELPPSRQARHHPCSEGPHTGRTPFRSAQQVSFGGQQARLRPSGGFLALDKRRREMAANNTQDGAVLHKRVQALKIIANGFADTDLDTVITDGEANGWVDGIA